MKTFSLRENIVLIYSFEEDELHFILLLNLKIKSIYKLKAFVKASKNYLDMDFNFP